MSVNERWRASVQARFDVLRFDRPIWTRKGVAGLVYNLASGVVQGLVFGALAIHSKVKP